MRRIEWTSLIAGAACLLFVGCGGDDPSVAPVTFPSSSAAPAADTTAISANEPTGSATSSTITATETVATQPAATTAVWPPSQELLDESILPISEMPTGWAAVADDDESSSPCGVKISSIVGVADIPSGRMQYAEDQDVGPYVSLAVGVLPPDIGNLDVLGTYKEALLACNETVDGTDMSFTELSYPTLGDQSFAYRMNLEQGNLSAHFDIVQIRSGDIIVQVAGLDMFGEATDILDQFAQPQLDRAIEVLA